jgi:MHS family shikimate/dehydroshikimate transporter-like MFS transporter
MTIIRESSSSVMADLRAEKRRVRQDHASTYKILAASALGTILEWYDFFVYGTAAALVFGRLFFPSSDAMVSTLAGLSVYAVGYFARPFGGIIFGHFGDRVGRKPTLVLSMLLMGFGTFFIGLLPTYEQIGILAPLLLILLRLIQAVGLGGEWGGAVLFVYQSAPVKRRGVFGSLVQLGNPIGRLAATGVFLLATRLPYGEFLSWGWRIPFLASALLIAVALVIRFRIEETPKFQRPREGKRTAKLPVIEVLLRYRRETIISLWLKITELAWVSILTAFAVAYLTQQLGMQPSVVLNAVMLATVIELFVIPLAGWLSDNLGRRTIYLAGTMFGIVLAFPIFWLFETRDPAIVTWAIVVGLCLCQAVTFALHASFMPELFGAHVRYTGISLGFQLGAAIGGGFTPAVVTAVVAWSGGETWPVSLLLVALGLLSIVAVVTRRDTRQARSSNPNISREIGGSRL